MLCYKGFKSDMACMGFQYKVGEGYKTEKPIKACENGFHACAEPFDVFDFYSILEDKVKLNRYAKVRLSGDIEHKNSKSCASEITIEEMLTISDMCKAQIDYMDFLKENGTVLYVKQKNQEEEVPDGFISTLYHSSSNASKIYNKGKNNYIKSEGRESSIYNSGSGSIILSLGDGANIASIAYRACILSTGFRSTIVVTESTGNIFSFGNQTRIMANFTNHSQIYSQGANSTVHISGKHSKIILAGCFSELHYRGEYGQVFNSGDNNVLYVTGICSLIKSIGSDCSIVANLCSYVQAKIGTTITFTDFYFKHIEPIVIKIDGIKYKENVWYCAKSGKVKEESIEK